jgi:membrane-bound ClpP family serine protease
MVSEVIYHRNRAGREPGTGDNNRTLVLAGALVMAFGLFAGVCFIALMGQIRLPFQDCVAVVNIDGEISSGGVTPTLFGTGSPGSEEIADAITSLGDRDDVKAVVVKVNSPGGGVIASKQIYDALRGMNKTKVA